MKRLIMLFAVLSLTGCPLEGDDGRNGATGPQGREGAQGAAGLSCWDLNENGIKDLASEDSNSDGQVNVLDCRAPIPIIPQGSVAVAPASGAGIIQQHTRRIHTVLRGTDYSDGDIVVYDRRGGTIIDLINEYQSAGSDNWGVLDPYVQDPISDPCNVWHWHDEGSNTWSIRAEDGLFLDSEHYAAVIVSPPKADNLHPDATTTSILGGELCASSCLNDERCIGAWFNRIGDIDDNAIICRRVAKSAIPLPSASEFSAVSGSKPLIAIELTLYTSAPLNGLISVCE